MAGEIIHVEFPSGDFAKSSEFFQTLFGWRPEGEQVGGHLAVKTPDGAQASLVMSALAYAPGPVIFVAVADVPRTLAEVVRLGGRVLAPKLNLLNRGAVALIADLDGNVVAVTAAQAKSASGKAEFKPESTSSGDGLMAASPPVKAVAPAAKPGGRTHPAPKAVPGKEVVSPAGPRPAVAARPPSKAGAKPNAKPKK